MHEKDAFGWWYYPGSGVDMDQILIEAAEREWAKEAGGDIEITGFQRLEYCGEIGRLAQSSMVDPEAARGKLHSRRMPTARARARLGEPLTTAWP